MADTTQAPINGGFPAQHAYHDSYSHAHVAATNAANFQPAQSFTPTNALPEQKNGISKDEVGWYFVEQYYTTMSRNPDKLPLFYARRSQLVFGTEAESVPVAVGQKAINEKIKQLDFQDCKVRVLNVDSQASFDNILIAVIGEISNKSEPSRKFVQTFVLAEQPNGYYVLNDVFRYLVDEEEIVNEETAPAAAPVAPAASVEEPAAAAASVEEPAAAAAAAEEPAQPEPESAPAVDVQETEAPAPEVEEKAEPVQENGDETQPQEVDPQVNGADADVVEPEQAAAVPEEVEAEKPPTPEPTPAPSAQKEAPAPPKENAPPAKALPKTWANIASKSGAPAPVVPSIPAAPAKSAPATGSSQPAAAAPAAPATPAPENVPSQPPSNDGSGWQTAGHDHKKTQSRVGEEQPVLAYIKNVNEKVDANLLKQTLTRFGKLKHFDVSRSKNCAFAEFAEPAGYAAAVAANPHQIGSEQIYVEERRARGNAYGGNANYTAGRGGVGRGRGDRAGSQGRGGFQRDGRGGFAPRGRGNVKNRNQPQAA